MKLSDVKDKIDQYFETVSTDDLIKRFVELGCEFEPIDDEYDISNFQYPDHNEAFMVYDFSQNMEIQYDWTFLNAYVIDEKNSLSYTIEEAEPNKDAA